ncbi:bile acid:sodium symporter family protein [Candidatus Laterigemmans baculatus]|uniref:bile acid:sodium symporter family protein n=1 Tax=Candidatus Laterigemmans baculatus TaxID=2770505 RepID=UPI0013D9B7D6|nr:bile acid:sodium symporter [Candidatus Laterigemmans baculatus]
MSAGSLFEAFLRIEGILAALQLVLAMLGMGATLELDDFRQIARHYRAIGLVLVAQFLLGPLAAVAAGAWLPLPEGVVLGVILLAVMPSGAMSNIFAHLGNGNLPLSITATVASTLTCLVFTPLLLGVIVEAAIPAGFQMPTGRIVRDVALFLLLPLLGGMWVRRRSPRSSLRFARWTVRSSLAVLAVIVVGSLGSGRIDVWSYGWTVPVILVGFVFVQFVAARLLTLAFRYSARDSYTLAIEVALRNGNLAILLSSTLFAGAMAGASAEKAEDLGAGALYVALFYGGASLGMAILAVMVERYWERRQLTR